MSVTAKPANDARAWSRGEPFTLFSERDGNMVCPGIARLPCGDLLVNVCRDGDYPLSRTRMLRSDDGGASWREDDLHHDFLPVKSPVVLDDGLVRVYGEAADVKGTDGKEYLYFYCDSTDGGRTFSEIKTGRYTLTEHEQPGPTIQGSAYWGVHLDLVVYRRALLEAAGWRMPRPRPGVGLPECFEARLRGPLGGSQRSCLTLVDGSMLSFDSACIAGERADPRNVGKSLLALVSHDRGVSWQSQGVAATYQAGAFPYEGYAHADCLPPWEHGYYEGSAVQLADGRVYAIMRSGGGGVPLCHAWSADGGRTWTPPQPIDRRVCGVAPKLLKLADGTLALCHGRPGIFVMFDPSGTGEHWQVDDRFDLTDGERLTLETYARPFVNRPDCNALLDHVNAPRATLDWVKPEILDAHYYSWENVDMCEVEPGRILVVYDLQSWVEEPGAPHRNTIRGTWLTERSD
jgi:hypothetical protein